MPRYYLSVRYRDRLFRDEEGEDIPSGIEMKVRALETARDLIRTPFLAIPDWLDCTLEVTDETGTMVLSLPFPGGFGCVKSLMSGPCTKSLLRQHFSSRGCRRHQDVPSMCSAEKESLRARFIWLDGSDGPCPCGT